MTAYTHTLTMALPYTPELADIASRISRALDPDVGGADSWTREVVGWDGDEPIYGDTLRCSTPCTEGFYAQAMAMLASPTMLHGAVAADYAARWADLTPPTLS